MTFRQAHHVTGRTVKRASELGLDLWDLPLEEIQNIEPRATAEVYKVLSPAASIERTR